MVSSRAILNLCEHIAVEFLPSQIILFGSHAYGIANVDSDVDILIVMARGPDGYRKAAEISGRAKPKFAVDFMVRTAAVLRKGIAMNDFFLKEIVEKGIVLYDAADERVGRQGRKRLQQREAAVKSAQLA